MKKNTDFNYNEAFMGVFQGRQKGFYKSIYKEKPELRRIVEMVKIKRGKMLDIGSGGGLMTECLPYYYPGVRIFGCDISSSAIAYAKKFGTGKVVYRTMTKKFPYPSDYFDVCLCSDVLEHVPDVPYFLSETRRVLKKGGIFFLAIPCEGQPYTLHWFFRKLGFWGNLTRKHIGHIHPEFTHGYVIKLFEQYGFPVLAKKYNERLLVQSLRYFLFMIPKEILESFVGHKKAESYYDRKVVIQSNSTNDVFMLLRKTVLAASRATRVIYDIDAKFLTNIGFTAGKINILVKNDK